MLWRAKNSGVARSVVASSATALAPFSQNSAVRRCPGSRIRPGTAHAVEAVDLIELAQRTRGPPRPHFLHGSFQRDSYAGYPSSTVVWL